ncbi:MAG: hypothetical protein M1825_003227 [Sarcosagium campestre]|nr:MAG: hypothetical protein M1825_003227 [Sarcosagium campestre]
MNGRIHFLGVGNVANFIAFALAGIPKRPPMTLLLHRADLETSWELRGRQIEVVTDNRSEKRSGFEVEVLGAIKDSKIRSLIVGTKTTQTVSALSAVKTRLDSTSTILFTQNGMGIADEVSAKVFTDPQSRPQYLYGVVSHGLYSNGPFSTTRAGFGSIVMGGTLEDQTMTIMDNPASRLQLGASSTNILEPLSSSPELNAREVPSTELIQVQLEKLIVNSVINPLTVLFNCINGELLKVTKAMHTIRLLLPETCSVIRSLPELQVIPGINARFSSDRMSDVVSSMIQKTASNTSSMLQDYKAGRPTEIDFINGYIIKRAQQLGKDCSFNTSIVRRVLNDELESLPPQ